MYEQFYNLTAEPFRLSPDHRFCYNHAKYAKAKAYMAYAFLRAEGFVLITGDPGTGKTTLVGDLIETLADENVAVGNLVSTQLAADDLLRMVAFSFGVDAHTAEKSVILQNLTTRFLSLSRGGGRALLIVDEAQDLSTQALEELRLLTNLQQDGQPLLQIFLLGQSSLQELVHTPGLEQVHQRIVAASQMEALGEEETRAYVEHRLHVVGWRNDPAISTAVYPIIYLFSEGVPRRINLFCSRLFLHCAVEQRHQITVEDARTVVEELQEEQLSTRNMLHDELFHASDVFELVSTPDGPASETREHNSAPEPEVEAPGGISDPTVPEAGAVEGAEGEAADLAPEILAALMDEGVAEAGASVADELDDFEVERTQCQGDAGEWDDDGVENTEDWIDACDEAWADSENLGEFDEEPGKDYPAHDNRKAFRGLKLAVWTALVLLAVAVVLLQMEDFCESGHRACSWLEPLFSRALDWLKL